MSSVHGCAPPPGSMLTPAPRGHSPISPLGRSPLRCSLSIPPTLNRGGQGEAALRRAHFNHWPGPKLPARVWDTGSPPSIVHGPPAVSSTVSSTVNSQSTHSQLNSQLTVNSQSTQRSTGPQNPGVLLRILENSGHQDHQKTLFNLIKIIKRAGPPIPLLCQGR